MKIKFTKFPDGQYHLDRIDIDSDFKKISVHSRIRNGDDILKLYLLQDVLKKQGKYIDRLTIYWLAGARWDREMQGHSFDLRIFSNLINGLNINNIDILDPHSYSAIASIHNSQEEAYSYQEFKEYVFCEASGKKGYDDFTIVLPDAGASKRFEREKSEYNYIQCDKTRTTNSIKVEVFNGILGASGKDLLIVDDICDGGATFIAVAEELKKYEPKSISLMVTHGIFSKGFDVLFSYFNKIYTTNSFQDFDSKNPLYGNRIDVFNIFDDIDNSDIEYFIVD